MTTIDRDYFASLPDKEMEAKRLDVTPYGSTHRYLLDPATGFIERGERIAPDRDEPIVEAIRRGMDTWKIIAICGLVAIAFGVLLVVFGGGK